MALLRSISITTSAKSSEPLFFHMGEKYKPDKTRIVTLRLIPNAASSGSSMSSGYGAEYTGIHPMFLHLTIFICLYLSYVKICLTGP